MDSSRYCKRGYPASVNQFSPDWAHEDKITNVLIIFLTAGWLKMPLSACSKGFNREASFF
jgi:hypothetical protein